MKVKQVFIYRMKDDYAQLGQLKYLNLPIKR